MCSQSSFPDSDGWGIKPWAPKTEQPAKGAKAVDNLFPIDIWQALYSAPNEAARERLYDTYMCSPAWRRNRRPALERANGWCEQCHRHFERLQVHHLTYKRFTRELPEDLKAVCHHCHPGRDEARREALAALREGRIREIEDLAEMRFDDARREAFHRQRCDGRGYFESSLEEIEESNEAFDEMLRESGDD